MNAVTQTSPAASSSRRSHYDAAAITLLGGVGVFALVDLESS